MPLGGAGCSAAWQVITVKKPYTVKIAGRSGLLRAEAMHTGKVSNGATLQACMRQAIMCTSRCPRRLTSFPSTRCTLSR